MYIIYCMEAHDSHYEGEVDVKKKCFISYQDKFSFILSFAVPI